MYCKICQGRKSNSPELARPTSEQRFGRYCLTLREPRAIRRAVSGKVAVLAEGCSRGIKKKQTEACGRT